MATITLDAGAAIELADTLDFLAEWIAEHDDDAFADHGYTTNAVLTNLARPAPRRRKFTLDTT
jgi:hypothetical protein